MRTRPYALDHGSRWPDPEAGGGPDRVSFATIVVYERDLLRASVAQALHEAERWWPIGVALVSDFDIETGVGSEGARVRAWAFPEGRGMMFSAAPRGVWGPSGFRYLADITGP